MMPFAMPLRHYGYFIAAELLHISRIRLSLFSLSPLIIAFRFD
jgi:hypothetical protein